MANYVINVTDNPGDDRWTVELRRGATLASDGTVESIGGTTLGDLHAGLQRAMSQVFNSIVQNGQL